MKVLELSSILKEDGYIYYINKYRATAKIEMLARTFTFPVAFTVEMNPLGMRSIEFEPLPREIDYPVLPLTKSLREFVEKMINDGTLPQT